MFVVALAIATFAMLIVARNATNAALWRWYVATEQDGWRRYGRYLHVQVVGSSVLVGWRGADGRVSRYIEL